MNNRTFKNESDLHKALIIDLLVWLRDVKGYLIKAADLEGYPQPQSVKNENGLGDGADKRPDIDAFDDTASVYVRGEAKTGDGDLESSHTETQLKLFASRYNTASKKESLLYIIVPAAKLPTLKGLLQKLDLFDVPNVIPVKSGKF